MKTKKHEAKRAFSLREFARKALTVLLTISMVTMNTPFAYAAEALDIAEDSKVVEQGTIVEEGTVGEEQDSKDAEKSGDGQLDDELPDVEPAEEELQNVELDSTEDEPSDVATTVSTQADEDPSQTEPIAEIVELEDITPDGEVELALDFAQAYITYQGQMIGLPMTSINVPANTDFRFSAAADEGCTLSVVKATLAGHETVLEPDAEGFYTIPAERVVAGISLSVKAEGDPFAIETSADDIDVQRNEKSEFEYEGKSIKVTATLTDPSALPEGVTFKVTPVTQKSKDYNYDAYMEALNNSAGEENKYNSTNTLLYDVAFLMPKLDEKGKQIADEWVEVQLDSGQVQINIEFKKDQLSNKLGTDDPSDIVVTHLPLIDSVRSSVDTTADAKSISAQDVLVEAPEQSSADVLTQSVEVSLDSLSLLAVRNTASAEEPQNAGQTQDETQDEPVAPSINESTNLANFLTSATFNAPQNQDGTYVVTPNTNYQFTLTFAERYNTDDTLQFPNSNADMTYTLPEGLEVADGHEGTFIIAVRDGANTYQITDNTYRIDGRVLTVNFNSSHEYFKKLTAAANAKFTLSFEGSISKDATVVKFSDGIEKTIEIDDSNYVTVLKNAKADLNNKKIAYTVTVQSHGNSENVNVVDTITSPTNNLLSLSPSSFRISTNKSSHNVSSITPTIDGNHFEYVIPQMYDGEIITIKYDAAIDPTKLTSANGRFASVSNNKVEAWSDGDPEHDSREIQVNIDYTPTISKSGKVTSIGSDKQTITWTIVANDKCAVSMAGTTITDTINTAAQSIMKYSGNGIVVTVTDATNNPVRTDTLAWNELQSKTDEAWSYLVPAQDAGKAYKYTITYTTEVDTTGVFSVTNVGNGVVTSGGKSSSASTSITPTNGEVTVTKEATNVDVANKRISWKVTYNVPAQGLDQAAFGDKSYSRKVNNKNFYELVIPDSVEVQGLIDNEYLRVRRRPNDNETWLSVIKSVEDINSLNASVGYDPDARIRYATFVNGKDPFQDNESEGCLPSDSDRIITLTFDTQMNDEWLEASVENGDLQTHINYGRLQINKANDKLVQANAIVVPPIVEKTATYAGSRVVNGVELPVYKYEVIFSGVDSDEIEITDDFDTGILAYYTENGVINTSDTGYIYGGGVWNQLNKGSSPFGVTYTDTGIQITGDASSIPHDGDGYYAKYRVVYYLAVKDEAALNTIKARTAAADGGVYNIHNSVSFKGMTDSADITFEYNGLDKELLTSDDDLHKTDEDIWPEFRITLNPEGRLLNKGLPLTMTDTANNLSVDVTSIKAEPASGVSWDMTGNTVTYTIPDATRVVITYKARVTMSTMPGVGESQQITFSNTAEMKGYNDTVEETAERSNNGQGAASIPSINLIKYEAGDMNTRLPGAKFQLQDANQKPIRDKDGKAVEFVSDANGMITIKGDMKNFGWAISEGQKYYLEELEAPAGYMLAGFKYQFIVSADGTTDYSKYIYYSGDTMTAKNYPGTDVRVLKTWTDGNQRHHSDSVEVTLQQKKGNGSWSNVIRMEQNDAWTDVQSRTITLDKDNDWTGVFDKLPLTVPVDLKNVNGEDVAVTYRVVETKVNGETPDDDAVKITRKAEDSGTYVYEITNKVDTGDLEVSKVLAEGSEQYTDQEFVFTVALGDKTISGEYGDMTFDKGVATVTLKGGQTAKATGLPADTGYTVSEAAVSGFQNTNKTGDSGAIVKDETSQATFTNARERGNLTVSKVLATGSEANANQEFTFTVTLSDKSISGTYGDMTFDKGVATVKLKGGHSATATDLPTGITYIVTEAEVEGFSNTDKSNDTGTISTTQSTATFTNKRDTGSLKVTKAVVSDAAADKTRVFTFTVTLGDKSISGKYGDMTFDKGEATVELTDKQEATATGLPVGITYKVVENEDGGFTTTQTGETGSIGSNLATAAFTNTRKTGELEVTKTVVSQKAGDKDLEFSFTVKLTDNTITGEYGGMQFTNGVATFTLTNGQKATASNLPTDVGYTVTEFEENTGQFTTIKTGDTGTISTSKSTAAFTNTRTTGDLEVKKTVQNPNAQTSNVEFSFTVRLTDTSINGNYGMTFKDGVATFTLKDGETKKATGLPTNVGYTVTEAAADGYVCSVPNSQITDTIKAGTSTAAFVNTRVEKGDLVVAKTVESALEADDKKEFEFSVTLSDTSINGEYGQMQFTNGKATFKLKDGQTKKAEGLPKGVTYTVEEKNDSAFSTQAANETGEILDDSSVTASFVNTRKTGKITVSKKVVSDAAADKQQSFIFTIQLDPAISGTFGTGTEQATFDAEGKTTITLKHDEAKTIAGLPRGVKYTITEAAVDGFNTTFESNTGTISETLSTVDFTNTRKTGELEVSKTLFSDVAADATQVFTFDIQLTDTSIKKTYSDVAFDNGKATIQLKGGEKKLIQGLPTGVGFTVTEVGVSADEFSVESNVSSQAISTTKSVAAFTNTRKTGSLDISKTVVSDAAADASQEFTFTIKLDGLSEGEKTKEYSNVQFTNGEATITLKGGEHKTIDGLPVGVTYTVTEASVDGFTVTKSKDTGTISKDLAAAVFTNTRHTGDLSVKKTVNSGLTADKSKEFEFTVTLSDTTIGGKDGTAYGDMTFKNGVATFKLADGQTKTATGLPTGITYTVTETADASFETAPQKVEGTIESTGSTAAFTNTNKTGELEISKILISDAAGDATQEFTFTITLKGLDDNAKNASYSNIAFTDGVGQVTLKGGEHVTIAGLPIGTEYTVEESAVTGFTLTGHTGDSGKISANKSEAKFTNTRDKGDLEVTKKVVSSDEADKDVEFTFTVTLSDPTIGGDKGTAYGQMTFINGVATFKLKHGQSAKATGLPTGITYTVTEQDVKGFLRTSNPGATGSITTKPAKAEFINTEDKGGLTVRKTVVSAAAADQNVEFDFTVTLDDTSISKKYGDMTFKDGVATFKLKGNQSATATGLPSGIAYTVTEAKADGFTRTGVTGNTGTIVKNESQVAEFTNKRNTGDLTVSKEVISDAAADKDQAFAFTVELSDKTISGTFNQMTFSGGKATFTLKDNESKTATGLPVGITYTVTEANTQGFTTTHEGEEGDITKDETKVAKFTNTRQTGNLKVSKAIVSGAADDADKVFEFTVTLDDTTINGTYGNMTFANGVAKVELKGGENATAEGLPTGVGYTVTEAEVEGFEVSGTTGTKGSISTTESVAHITNKRQTGELVLSKELLSDAAADAGQEFEFTVKLKGLSNAAKDDEYGGVKFEDGEAIVKLIGGQTKTIDGLPTGVEYTVTETSTEGFELTGKTGDEGTIATTTSTAAFQNTRNTGKLVISKDVISDVAGDADQKFTFTVTLKGLTDDAKNNTYSDVAFSEGVGTVTINARTSKTIEGLPIGVEYTVTEADAEGFELTGKTGDTGKISKTASVAKFTNTRKTGDLQLSKKLVSDAAADASREFTFAIELGDKSINKTYSGVKFTSGSATVKLKGKESKTIEGLPAGITYTITEAGANGGEFTTEASGANGTISATKKAEATFTNTRRTGDLEVTKSVPNVDGLSADVTFEFTVELSDKTINTTDTKTYGDMTFINGVATFKLGDGQKATATGLPTGITYTVTETPTDGYTTTPANGVATGNIVEGKTTTEFVNTRVEKGDLVVSKTVESELEADHTKKFEFTVTLSNKTISGKYGDMEFTNGVATFTLKDGEFATATGLPNGTRYTVTETADGDFETTKSGESGTVTDRGTATAAFKNTRKTGELQLSKTVISDAATDKAVDFTFTIALEPALSGTFGTGDAQATFDAQGKTTITLKDSQTKTIKGLPYGVKYTVTEANTDGFTLTSKVDDKGTISAATSKASFTNTRETGDLELSKVLVSDAAADANHEFTFVVELSDKTISNQYGDMTFVNGVATVKLKGDHKVTATGLPTGITYTITEAEANGNEFTTQTSGATGTISTSVSKATFTNTRRTGKLELTKKVNSDAAADLEQEFAFTITLTGLDDDAKNETYSGVAFKDGVGHVTLKDGVTKTIDGLPYGVGYTITEDEAEGFTTEAQGAEGTISATPAQVNFNNTRQTGDLELTKKVVSDAAADAATQFTFTVELSDKTITKTYGDMAFTNGVATVKLVGDQTAKATGLPTGLEYTITEADADGFKLTSKTGEEGTISTTKSEATFTNTREVGDLELSKEVVSDATADKTQEFTFTITLGDATIGGDKGTAYGDVTFVKGVATVTLTDGNKVTAEGLPTGITYTIVETTNNAFQTQKTGATGTISTKLSKAKFTNTRKTGDLKLSKELLSDAADDKDQEFEFTIALKDEGINETYSGVEFKGGKATVTLKGGYSKLIQGLPTGVDYTITEASVEDFQLTGSTGSTGTIATALSEAKFTNKKDQGGLIVSKTVVSDATADHSTNFKFTVTLSDKTIGGKDGTTYGQMTFKNGVATFSLKDGETKSATDLPVGITYTVTEEEVEGFTLTSKTDDTGTITKDKTQRAEFTNTRQTGNLKLSKVLVSDAAADSAKEFEFSVVLNDTGINKTYSGVEFKDGRATVVIKGAGSQLIEGLPTGVKYTITEKDVAGFKLTGKTGDTGTISTAESVAEFTNTREVGDLKLAKVLRSEAQDDQDQVFTFTIKLTDTTINKTYSDVKFVNGEATVTLKGGEEQTIKGLPTGVGYTITEADVEGFQVTNVVGQEGTISTNVSTATFTNTREVGDLTIKKTVKSDATADKDQEFTFTVTLTDKTIGGENGTAYGDLTFKNGVATVKLKGGEKATAIGLPTGIKYTVTEADAEGFELTSKSGEEGTISTIESVAEFTNTRKTGDLQLSKILLSDAAADKDQVFTFTITLTDRGISNTYGDATFVNGVATVTIKGSGDKTIKGLPTGIGYTIAETTATGFNVKSVGEIGSITTTKSEATFTNTRQKGDLTVKKTVKSDAAADKNQVFTFTVTLSDNTIGGLLFGSTYGDMTFRGGVATVTLKDGETATATGLPTGITYTVTEADVQGFTLTGKTGDKGAISTTGATAEFTNTRETGSLELTKKLNSGAQADKGRKFTFTITLSDTTISKTYSGVTFTNGVATVTLTADETKLIEGLPTGITYTVTEVTSDAFTTESKGEKGTIATDPSKVVFTNTRKTGDLKLSKVLVSEVAADASQEFTFTVTFDGLTDDAANEDYDGVQLNNGVASITLKGGEEKTIKGLPVGVGYTITEAEVDGFQNTGKVGDTGTISTTLSEATFTNTKDKGGLIVSKTVVSDAADDASQEFTFTITLGDNGINKTYSGVEFVKGVGTITLKGGEAKQIEGLPNGITYTVTEEDAVGFELTGQTGSTGTIAKGTTARAEFTNTRTTGTLTVSKDVISDAADDANQLFSFTVTLTGLADTAKNKTYGDVEFASGVGTFTLKGGEEKKIDGLPTGIAYTVTEASAAGFELTGVTGDEGKIATTPTTAKFTNTREVGDLTVSKTTVSDATADKDQKFTFTVTLNDNTISGTYGDLTFAGGVATVELKGGETATAEGLPTGVTYEVTEVANSDFVTKSTDATGTINTDGSTASFTNTRKTGELTVSKSVTSSTPADKKKGFLFRVTLSDTGISGTYGQMGFRNGVATFALADGQTKSATDLPTGMTYTVEETSVDGFVTTSTGTTGQITTTPATAAFTNTKDEGGLLVSKSVNSSVASDKTKAFNFTVTLDDTTVNGTYGQMTFVNGVATFTLADGKNMSATGLAAGIGYKVTETADDLYVTTYEGQAGKIAKNQTAQAKFTNTRKTGDLTVSKTLVSDAAADAAQSFVFTVTLDDNSVAGTFGDLTFANGVATVALKGGEDATANGLPANVGYTITEKSVAGIINTEVTGQIGTIATKPTASSFTNTREVGDLTVSKTTVSDATADKDQKFTFTVTLKDNTISGTYGDLTFAGGVATVELKGGDTATAKGLPTGVGYTVTETADGNFDTEATGTTGTISTTPATASFTNTRKVGDLTVSKKVFSDAAADKDQTFTFTVTLQDTGISGTYGQMTFDAGKATVELKGGESATATGLPTGITYQVAEAANDDFITTSNNQSGAITTTPATAEFTNTRNKGGLIVSKELVSDAAADKDQEFNFTVTLNDKTIGGASGTTYGDMTFKNGVATFTLKGGEVKQATDLPTGITYTVTETENNDFVTTSTGEEGTITKTEAAHAAFTNTRKVGDLKISKTVVSDAAADASQRFIFDVTLSDDTIAGTYGDITFDAGKATVELKGGEEATAEGLPTGVDYTVTEQTVEGFQNTEATGTTGAIATTPATASFTNTREKGDLTVSKELVSRIEADSDLEFTLNVVLSDSTITGTYGDMTFDAGKATVALKGGESATATGLPTSITYQVTEAQESSNGFDVQTTNDEGTIVTTGATATFTNTRLLGSLKIQKQVTMDGVATNTTAADGTYTFLVTGPGAYEEGVRRTITINNGRSETLTLDDLFVGDYTISEVTTDLPANMRLLSQSPQTITVEADNEQSIPVAEFHNDIKSTQAAFEVTKQFNNWDNAKTNTFSFKLTPVGDAPMPKDTLVPNQDVCTATSDVHTATFGSITFTREGTYAYKLSEVVPEGADENGVFEGIAYDTTEHDVMVNVTADEDGALHAQVLYDVAQTSLTITNTYEATGSTTLTGTKVLAGRPFREGDTWTFAITQPEGQNGPVPEHESVTVDAFADATIDFGTIGDFTFEDVGKTFTYEVSESGSVEDVANDAQVKTVTLTIEDNGDGTLNVVNSAEDEKTPLTFTNTYLVHEDLVAYKGLTGRKWYTNDKGEVAEEYSFELYDAGDASARKREESKVSNKAITHGANHTAKFGTFTFTHEDVGSVFGYTVREVSVTDEQAEQGMTVDAVMYDVTFEVVEQDGEVKVLTNYSYGVDKEGNTLTKDRLEFVNSYKAKPTKATIQAQKVLQGRDIKDGEFAFELYSVASDGTRFKQQTKSVSKAKDSEPSVVTFDDIDCVEAGTMNYVIKEVIPQDAVEDKDGNWKKDGITYDATEHKVKVVTTDDYEGQLHAEVVYEDLEQGQTMPVLTNTYFGALANIEFDKAYYGTNDTAQFEFILTAADKDFAPREANNSGTITYDPASITQQTPLVDFGQAFSIVQTNGAFKNNLAKVSMPTITYHEPGTYYYVISENADGQNANLSSDQASILVTVDVNEKAKASVSYQIRDDEDVTEVAKDAVATLYNNEMITLGFRSRALRQLNAQARVASYQPTVRKVLKNGVLKGGEFQFALYEGTDTTGLPLQVVSNDVNGAVSFDAITYTDANVGQTYTYTIVEQPSSDETVVIDDHAIRLAIKVSEGAEGQIVVEGTYSDVDQSGALTQTTDPTFVNNYDTIVIHAVKRSREEPYDPLPGAHYGLWMVNPDGEDVYMGLGRNQVESEGAELVSSENGDLYYDLPLLEGVAYYFLEEWPPPAGHLVDPYPTDYFTLVHDKEAGTFRLVYEADADFAKYCPGITR